MKRNAIQLLAGALAAVVTAGVVGTVLYYVAEYFRPLPRRR